MYIKKVWVGVEKGEQVTVRDNTGNIHYPTLHFVTLHYTGLYRSQQRTILFNIFELSDILGGLDDLNKLSRVLETFLYLNSSQGRLSSVRLFRFAFSLSVRLFFFPKFSFFPLLLKF